MPARIPFETRVIDEVIRRGGFEIDAVPDLLFVNYKLIDSVGHTWSLHSEQMRHAMQEQDAELPQLVRLLDQAAGRGRWVVILTADHGSQPDPARTGKARLDIVEIERRIEEAFGDGVVDQVQTTQVFLDVARLEEGGGTVSGVASLLGRSTLGGRLAASFRSDLLGRLRCLPEARS